RATRRAARGRERRLWPEPLQELSFAIGFDDRVLMAMNVHEGLLACVTIDQLRILLGEKVAEKKRLIGKFFCEPARREEIDQFVLECRHACRLEADNWRTRFDLRPQHRQCSFPKSFCLLQPAPIVERPTAAK